MLAADERGLQPARLQLAPRRHPVPRLPLQPHPVRQQSPLGRRGAGRLRQFGVARPVGNDARRRPRRPPAGGRRGGARSGLLKRERAETTLSSPPFFRAFVRGPRSGPFLPGSPPRPRQPHARWHQGARYPSQASRRPPSARSQSAGAAPCGRAASPPSAPFYARGGGEQSARALPAVRVPPRLPSAVRFPVG